MALKADREITQYENGYFLNEAANKGLVVCVSTGASGAALDGATSVATVAAASSGAKPLGVLLDEFITLDQTRFHKNYNKLEAVAGDKASIAVRGWVVTDKVISATAGSKAMLASSGYVTDATAPATYNEVANPKVGAFLSGKDQNGFARLQISLP